MPMKRTVFALAVAASVAFTVSTQAAGEDVAVIVNRSNPTDALTMAQLRKIVLAQEGKWPAGGKIVVWMTAPGQPERAGTLKIVCGMTETDFTLHFLHASFNGDGGDLPKAATSGAQVRQSIAAAVNGVGFIAASQVDDSVQVVLIDGNRPGQPAYKLRLK
jgi:ABC-type phosphate transport system substrate-binding protein